MLGTAAFAREAQQPRMFTLYVGTYTTGKSKSEGIYLYRMNGETGELTRVNAFRSVNPSFLAIDRSRRYLYAVNEVGQFLGAPSGGVSSFAIDPANGNLRLLNEQATQGADPCHLTVDRKRKTLLVANYTGGNVAALPIRSDGTLGMAIDVKQHEGSGIKEQQKGPHAHCIILDRSERYALAADLGIDKVMIYRLNPSTGKLEPAQQPWSELKPGAGPRHLTLHPNGKYAYVINELDSTMTALKYNGKGTLTQIETVSTLPCRLFRYELLCRLTRRRPRVSFSTAPTAATTASWFLRSIRARANSNPSQHVSTEGKWPRNFTIDPTGNFLLVANQHTDNVVTFKIDTQTGRANAHRPHRRNPDTRLPEISLIALSFMTYAPFCGFVR